MNQSGHTISWDSRLGQQVTTYRFTDKTLGVTFPTGSWDHSLSVHEGIYSASYKVSNSTGYGMARITSQVETQPLLTAPIFRSGGTHALSDNDFHSIVLAENDPSLWKKYVNDAPASPLGWYAQFRLWGTETWLAPAITLKTTQVTTSTPDFSALGKTGSPGPGLPNGGNWLLTSMESEQMGPSCWVVTQEWRASVNGPWDPDLYLAAS